MKKLLLLIIIFLTISSSLTSDWYDYERIQTSKSLIEIIYEESGVQIPESVDHHHLELIYAKGIEYNIPIRLLFRIINQESRFNPNAKSHKGAQGYMQIMPATWIYIINMMGWPKNTKQTPERNIIAGIYYLRYLYDIWNVSIDNEDIIWLYVLASYNAGIGKVIKYNGMPPYKETQNYIAYIYAE